MTVLVLLLGEAEVLLGVLPRDSTTVRWLEDASFPSLSGLLIIS